jgi:hypothetical protein
MSGVFRNIDNPPPHCPASVYPLARGRTNSRGGEGGGGSIVRRTPDTALYSMYVSTLWDTPTKRPSSKDSAAKKVRRRQGEKNRKREK